MHVNIITPTEPWVIPEAWYEGNDLKFFCNPVIAFRVVSPSTEDEWSDGYEYDPTPITVAGLATGLSFGAPHRRTPKCGDFDIQFKHGYEDIWCQDAVMQALREKRRHATA